MTRNNSGWFLDKDSRDELREQGIIATSPAAWKLLRVGSILAIVGMFPFQQDSFPNSLFVVASIAAGATTLIVLLTGLSSSRGYVAFPGSERSNEHSHEGPSPWGPSGFRAPAGAFSEIISSIGIVGGAALGAIAGCFLLMQLLPGVQVPGPVAGELAAASTQVSHTQHILRVSAGLQKMTSICGSLIIVLGIVVNGIAILRFHARHRR